MDLDDDELLATRKMLNTDKTSKEDDESREDKLNKAFRLLVDALTPIWEQKMTKNKMSKEEAIDIVDSMYQEKMHTIEDNSTIYVKRLEDVEFTNLEFAAVVLLRETQILDRKLNDFKKKVKNRIKEFECTLNNCSVDDEALLYSKIDVYEHLIYEFKDLLGGTIDE